jgi:hypothetical protein
MCRDSENDNGSDLEPNDNVKKTMECIENCQPRENDRGAVREPLQELIVNRCIIFVAGVMKRKSP